MSLLFVVVLAETIKICVETFDPTDTQYRVDAMCGHLWGERENWFWRGFGFDDHYEKFGLFRADRAGIVL